MSDWKAQLRRNFTQLDPLADFLELDTQKRQQLLERPRFVMNLPYRLAEKIEKNTLEDPLLRQFVPLVEEMVVTEGFKADPVGDEKAREAPKLLHKYSGRVLLVCTKACAMHCRYCFRQQFDYAPTQPTFDEEIEYIKSDSSIHEVILSGGDPLSLSEGVLERLVHRISSIPHVSIIRFHTRFIIGIPERVNPSFISLLKEVPQQIYVVIHVNHPKELDPDIWEAIRAIQSTSTVVLNQAVLLKGVNDQVEVLYELCDTLSRGGVLPYYLHQLDRIQGAAHFEVPEVVGKGLIEKLTAMLPGYAVPKYVKELPGEQSKTPCL